MKKERDLSKTACHLRTARESRRLSQSDVAKILGLSSPQFVSNWERGLSQVPLKTLRVLVRVYQLDPTEITEIVLLDQRRSLEKAFAGLRSGPD